MKLLRFNPAGEADRKRELDLSDWADIAAALQERFPDLGAYDLLRGAFAVLDGKLPVPDAFLH